MSHEVNWLKLKKHINCIRQQTDFNSNEIKTIFPNTTLFMYHKHHLLSSAYQINGHACSVDSKAVFAFKGIRWHFWSWLTWNDKVQSSDAGNTKCNEPNVFSHFEVASGLSLRLARCPQLLFKETNTTLGVFFSLPFHKAILPQRTRCSEKTETICSQRHSSPFISVWSVHMMAYFTQHHSPTHCQS